MHYLIQFWINRYSFFYLGRSVNDGIDSKEFPTKMSSTLAWLKVLRKVGPGGFMMKTDWADAYKHCTVSTADTELQWFTWLGKAFKELCLIFGGASIAGIFDAVAKIVLFIVLRASGFSKDLVIQHLDDICAAAPPQLLDKLKVFDKTFFKIAAKLGVI